MVRSMVRRQRTWIAYNHFKTKLLNSASVPKDLTVQHHSWINYTGYQFVNASFSKYACMSTNAFTETHLSTSWISSHIVSNLSLAPLQDHLMTLLSLSATLALTKLAISPFMCLHLFYGILSQETSGRRHLSVLSKRCWSPTFILPIDL